MDDWKFRHLIEERALFFPNVNKMIDEYEVTISDRVMDAKRRRLGEEGLKGRDREEEMARFFSK